MSEPVTMSAVLDEAAAYFGVERSPFYLDPVGWCHSCIDWRTGEGLTDYQEQAMRDLIEHGRVALRGPHGSGKTTTDALLILWYADTRDAAGVDWKLPTTATAWRQLTRYLWPEVHKWLRRVRWENTARKRAPLDRQEALDLSLKLRHGQAFAVASDDSATIEGAHGEALFYLLDEARNIPPDTWDAIEGAFAGAGADTGIEAFALANSTPGDPEGRFYDIHQRKPGYEDWYTVHVTKDDAVHAGRMSAQWAAQRAKQWGEKSAMYQRRVLGNFASSEADTVVSLDWVEAANDRWRELEDADAFAHLPLRNLGVDVARSGTDETVLAMRYKPNVIARLLTYTKSSTMQTTGLVLPFTAAAGVFAVVDVVSIGAGVVDRLREQDADVIPFNGSAGTKRKDRAGLMGFTNTRSAAYWNLRELLDPDSDADVALPPDDLLTSDLVAPKWSVTSSGLIQVEPKEHVMARLGRSPDRGDAVAMAFWPDRPVDYGDLGVDAWAPPPKASSLTGDLLRAKW